MVSKAQIVQWLETTNTVLQENRDYLTQLDSAIGDADHGTNMSRGFTKVMDKLSGETSKDIGTILKLVGMTLISSVGGASGPLYGTFYTRAGMVTTGKEQLTNQDLLALLQAGVEGVVQRGRAQPEDKTMCDVWWPALDGLRQAVEADQDTVTALRAAVNSAEAGLKATIPLQARKGRASYLGQRSIGHQDPGGTSSYLILKALLDSVES
jgi:dihydroxyacetone kinase-like protein